MFSQRALSVHHEFRASGGSRGCKERSERIRVRVCVNWVRRYLCVGRRLDERYIKRDDRFIKELHRCVALGIQHDDFFKKGQSLSIYPLDNLGKINLSKIKL